LGSGIPKISVFFVVFFSYLKIREWDSENNRSGIPKTGEWNSENNKVLIS